MAEPVIKAPNLKTGNGFSLVAILVTLLIVTVGLFIYSKITTQEITITDANGNVTTLGHVTTRLGMKKKPAPPAAAAA